MSWFLIALIAIIVIDIFVFLADKYVLSFLIFVGALFGYQYFQSDQTALEIAKTFLFEYGAYYIGFGVATAALKWVLFNFKIGRELKRLSDKYNAEYTKRSYSGFLEFIHDRYNGIHNFLKHSSDDRVHKSQIEATKTKDEMDTLLTPMASKQKERITFWILQWPIVMLTMLVEDLLIKIGHRVAELFDYLMKRFSKMLVSRATSNLNIGN